MSDDGISCLDRLRLLSVAGRYLVSPSGRFLLVTCAGAGQPAQSIREALEGRILADIEIDDREEQKTLAAVSHIANAAPAAGPAPGKSALRVRNPKLISLPTRWTSRIPICCAS